MKRIGENEIRSLTKDDFTALFGMTESEFPNLLFESKKKDFFYNVIGHQKRNALIKDALRKIENREFKVAGKEEHKRWHDGWAQKLAEFKESGCNLNLLVPQYIHVGVPARLYRDFVMPLDAQKFEISQRSIFFEWLFKKYFSDVSFVYEFGCGTGINLAQLAQIFPKKEYYGLDWAPAAADMVDLIGEKLQCRMKGCVFNMFSPDEHFALNPQSGVLLVSSLEQMGTEFVLFLDYLIAQKPRVVVVVDVFCELLDDRYITDYLLTRFVEVRNYLRGFLDALYLLERKRRVQIMRVHHSLIGGPFMEGQSYIVWKPKEDNR